MMERRGMGGWEVMGEDIFVYIQQIHVALQTATQHRKTTILQLKLNLKDELGDKQRCFPAIHFKEAMNKQYFNHKIF